MSFNGISTAQRKAFFATVRQAAREQGEQAEEYRKRILREELGVESLSDVARGGDFDAIMARALADCGEHLKALGYSMGSLSRIRHLIVEAATQIVTAKDGWSGTAYDYMAGVMIQSGMVKDVPARVLAERLVSDSAWLDFTEPQLKRLLVMLNIHLSRIDGRG